MNCATFIGRNPFPLLPLLLSLFLAIVVNASAQLQLPPRQGHPELYVTVQDSIALYLVSMNGDTIKPNQVWAAWEFGMLYDSTSHIMYTFTECAKNGSRIRFNKWNDGRVINADAPFLSFNTATDTFTCVVGDTLSFYREIRWRDPRTGWTDTNSYYALDSLDYAVELVRISDSTRVALLDSIGIPARTSAGRPVVHGMRPLMARARYVVPEMLNNTKAFIRIRVYHRGGGEYWFTRIDEITIALSDRLADTNWIRFINLFSPGSSKIVAGELERSATSAEQPNLLVENRVASNTVAITFDGAPDGGGTAVAVYDVLGNVLFLPYMTPGLSGQARVEYQFDHPGTYFIGLLHSNRLVAVRKIIINQ